MSNLTPINIRKELKEILELNKKNSKTTELGKSLEYLLNESSTYKKLIEAKKVFEEMMNVKRDI